MRNKIDNFYIKCMNCPHDEKQCPEIWKELGDGVPPRGFYYISPNIDILVVAKNPGHPFIGESDCYAGKKDTELFEAYRKHQNIFYSDLSYHPERSSTFHKNLFRYISFFLDIENSVGSIYSHIAHTNLVKCSSYDEQAKLNKTTMNTCFAKYFLDEISLFRPKVLLALGREVEKFLTAKARIHNLPVVGIKHPSYYYRKTEEQDLLQKMKDSIRSYLE